MTLRRKVKMVVNEIMFHLPYFDKLLLERYEFMHEPDQLFQICQLAAACKDVEGAFVEIGCAYGATTVFLNKYLRRLGMTRKYISIDTFAGFPAEDIMAETGRGKQIASLWGEFGDNKQKYYDASLRLHGFTNVKSIQSDATKVTYDFPVAFCLLDVDLYRPMQIVIPQLYRQLSPGGIIVCDDCSPGEDESATRWDGSLQAYNEFMAGIGQPPEILCGKLGVIRKPRS